MPLWAQLLLQVVLIMINAIFASAEIAIVSMNDVKLEKLAKQGNKKAKRLVRLTSKPASFLATIQVAITLSGFLGSAFAADNFSELLVDLILKTGVDISRSTLDTISVIVITMILSYLTLVFGELVPKRIAMRKSENLALGVSGLISVISKIFAPLVWLLTVSTNIVLRCLGIDPNAQDEEISEEEIRMLVDVGSEKGIIEKDEKLMITNIFDLNDKECGEFSTHRTDVLGIDIESTVKEWDEIIINSSHSVYPVFKENIDNIVGVLDSKKYFRLKNKTKEAIIDNAVSQPVFVPENMKIDVLFENMQKSRNHFSVVLDEYGGTVGIITMNDLLEEIVGDLENESSAEKKDPDILQIEENKWLIYGCASLDDVEEVLEIKLPIDEYETFSGYVFGIYCTIPEDNSAFTVETEQLFIEVLNVVNHTVEKAYVTIKK
ncbi:MAG: HlyC/CorC family transporter [Eubacterium sp.]|jgi:putative hemolysin|nr:HlyC/CorC family transporter [Eubacterium sp.]